jgi:MOSC domain-containing protein YiiM
MRGVIVQINISPGGIPKRAIPEAVVTPAGIQGDSWAHPQSHAGPGKALLVVSAETIDELRAEGFPVFPGALGENLTVRGIDRRQMRTGQRYRAGEVWFELTTVRVPCETLDVYGPSIRAALYDRQVEDGDAASPRWARAGFYAAVVQPGAIRPGDPVLLMGEPA